MPLHGQRGLFPQDAVVQRQLAVCQGGSDLTGVLIDPGDLEGVDRLAAGTELGGFGGCPVDGDLTDEVLVRFVLQRVGHLVYVVGLSANDHQNVPFRLIAVTGPGDDRRTVSTVAIDVILHRLIQGDAIPIGGTSIDAWRLVVIGAPFQDVLGQLIHPKIGQAHGDTGRPAVVDGTSTVGAPLACLEIGRILFLLRDIAYLTVQNLVRRTQRHIGVAERGRDQHPTGGQLCVRTAGCSPVLLCSCGGLGGLGGCGRRSLLCRLHRQWLHRLRRPAVRCLIGLRTSHRLCRSDSWF